MATVGVVGAGLIGRAWAVVFARGGFEVRLADATPDLARSAHALIRSGLDDLSAAGLLDEDPALVHGRITPVAKLEEAIAGADHVQENLPERLDVKREAYERMDALAAPGTVLASSTSAIPGSAFAEGLPGRHRVLVAHPVNPPHLVPLVELCRTPWTSDEALRRTRALMERVGQVPVTVEKEVEGFVLNRLQGALMRESLALVANGYISAEDLDRTVRDGLGLRWSFMGPFETIDLNAPGGVADYAARYGDFYDRIAAEPVPQVGWTHPVVAGIHAERRGLLPRDQLAARQAWRDRRLMALVAHKRKVTGEE